MALSERAAVMLPNYSDDELLRYADDYTADPLIKELQRRLDYIDGSDEEDNDTLGMPLVNGHATANVLRSTIFKARELLSTGRTKEAAALLGNMQC